MSTDTETPKKNKAPVPPKCSTPSVKLEHLDTDVFTKTYIDTCVEKRSNESPEYINKNTEIEPSTPRAHIEFSEELRKVLHDRNVLTSKTKKTVFEALDEIKTKGEEENRRYKREKALLEIVNSEIKYVHQLEIIINFFSKPTEINKLLKNDEFQTVFGSILPIYNVNKELLDELEKNPGKVAEAFCKFAPFFKMYSVYACEFKNILNILQNARSLNPQFAKLMENQESRPEVQNKLSALLITPIQRVPRYKLLLTHLLQLTKPHEKDHKQLTECLEKIEEAADHINKIVEDQENMRRLLEIQRFLKSGEPNIVKPGRTLSKEGILVKMGTKNAPSEKLYAVLMNDIILFGKMKKDELKVNSMKCVGIFPLGKCKVFEILDKGCMRISCQEEELILYHDQFSQTKSWIKAIKEAIDVHLTGKKTLRKDSSSRRPVKRKDLFEYHEVGLSPGKPLTKRRKISSRRPISGALTNTKPEPFSYLPPVLRSWDEKEDLSGRTSQKKEEESVNGKSNEIFLFGKRQDDAGFKVGKFLGVVGTSIKKLFGFKH
ncbi:FYVE, RhoGEF and PH domain-containing protein 4 [Diorhabda sublineata]|uniref:FYVE, RhoGEF and PH domain-containing protein 4 n=1 Tax=Diorhabda sublineata TaxID=1163346 RepID=UPI0024E0E415|nr:FYVE, RhoGEF and PH domain-containing protein 4 [Diorhabda sublineata]